MLPRNGIIVRTVRALRRERSNTADPQALADMKAGCCDKLDDQIRQAVQRNVVTLEGLTLAGQLVVNGRRAVEPARPQDRIVEA